jgi:hypothetical protein
MTELTSFPYIHGHTNTIQHSSLGNDASLDILDFEHPVPLVEDEGTVKRAITLAYAILICNYTGDLLIRYLCLEVLGDSKESWSVKQISGLADSQAGDATDITVESIPQSSTGNDSVAAPNIFAYLSQDKSVTTYKPLQRCPFQLFCSLDNLHESTAYFRLWYDPGIVETFHAHRIVGAFSDCFTSLLKHDFRVPDVTLRSLRKDDELWVSKLNATPQQLD